MVAKYGEDFAEQFAADLLDEQTYKKVMSIQDQKDRRKAIAEAISDGVANGTIDQQKAYENPDFAQWLDAHADLTQDMCLNANNEQITHHENTQDSQLESGLSAILGQPN